MRPAVFVFDAYGTLFDVASAARTVMAGDPARTALWPHLAEEWRRKQLEYTWLRSLMAVHADFAAVTADALDWVLEAQGLGQDRDLRARLLAAFDRLTPFPEVTDVLARLGQRGARLAILSNGTPLMLDRLLGSAGLDQAFEAVLSVETVGIFKPAATVYAMVETALRVPPAQTLFISSNGWDVAGAARFGFTAVWVNRGAQPLDRLPHGPAHIMPDLKPLADFL